MASKVFITGGSSGIGLATAQLFASKGWRVVVTGRDARKLDAARKTLPPDAAALVFDVGDRAALDRARSEHADAFREVDVLVNNAGHALGVETVQEADPADWDAMIDTNVRGLLNVTRAILPDMVRRGRGHVVNLGSTAGHGVYKGGTVYCATKHAERAISAGLRHDLLGTGVRVSSVDPGYVETAFSVHRLKGDAAAAKKVYEGYTPLRATDIAETVWWVVDRPQHVNVQEVLVLPTDQAWLGLVHKRG